MPSVVKYKCTRCNHIFPSDKIVQIYCPHCHGSLERMQVKVTNDENRERIALIQYRNRFHGRQKGRAVIAVKPPIIFEERKKSHKKLSNCWTLESPPKVEHLHSGDSYFLPEVPPKKKWKVRHRRV